MNEIKITPEIKNLAKEYLEECPYLHNKEDSIYEGNTRQIKRQSDDGRES